MIRKHRWGRKGRPKERNTFFWKYFQPIERTNICLYWKSHSKSTIFISTIQNRRKNWKLLSVYVLGKNSHGSNKNHSLGIIHLSKILVPLQKLTLTITTELRSSAYRTMLLVTLDSFRITMVYYGWIRILGKANSFSLTKSQNDFHDSWICWVLLIHNKYCIARINGRHKTHAYNMLSKP